MVLRIGTLCMLALILNCFTFSHAAAESENSDGKRELNESGGRDLYANRSGVFQSIIGSYLERGDRILNIAGSDTINVLSGNLESSSKEYDLATCALKKIGKPLPKSMHGVYWADFGSDSDELYGYTLDWFGLGNYRYSYSFINKRYQGIHLGDCQGAKFVTFAMTLYHEVKGHNIDQQLHNTEEQARRFDMVYENPVITGFTSAGMCEIYELCRSKLKY